MKWAVWEGRKWKSCGAQEIGGGEKLGKGFFLDKNVWLIYQMIQGENL